MSDQTEPIEPAAGPEPDPAHDLSSAEAAEPHEAHDDHVEVVTPVIVDLGKVKTKRIKRLKRGEGPLVDEVIDVIDEVVDALGEDVEDKALLPIVMVYEKKKKRKRGTRVTLPF